MSMTWGLNLDNHDLVIGQNGSLLKVYGAEEVRQRILVSLLHNWEEYFLNVPAGVPWYQLILGSKDKKMVETILRRRVLEVPGVASILDFQLIWPSTSTARQMEVYMSVEVLGQEGPEIIDLITAILLQ